MKFVVTGGAGFIGSNIARKLIELNRGEVHVIDNLSVGDKGNVPAGAIFHWGDIRDKESFEHVLDGADVVFHNAAYVSIRGSFDRIQHDLEVNDLGTLNMLEACRDKGVSKFIFASSMAVYGDIDLYPIKESVQPVPISPYGYSKMKGEYYCELFSERYGLKSVVLRYFNTYGIGQTPSDYVGVTTIFINQVLNNKPITICGDGKQTRDFIFVEDVAAANIEAAFRDVEGIFNIASGKEVTINSIADYVMEAMHYNNKKHIDAPPGEISRMLADIGKAKDLLGLTPEVDLKNRVSEIAAWWKNKYMDSLS